MTDKLEECKEALYEAEQCLKATVTMLDEEAEEADYLDDIRFKERLSVRLSSLTDELDELRLKVHHSPAKVRKELEQEH